MSSFHPSDVLRQRLRQVRREQDISQERLAELMTEQGHSWVRSTVAKIEATGPTSRQVTIDELIALAFVLGVPPSALLVPKRRSDMNVTPTTVASSDDVWRWMSGDLVPTFPFGVIPEDELEDRIDEVLHLQRRYDAGCPDYIENAERTIPGVRWLASLVAQAQYVAGSTGGGDRTALLDLLDKIERRAGQLHTNLERE